MTTSDHVTSNRDLLAASPRTASTSPLATTCTTWRRPLEIAIDVECVLPRQRRPATGLITEDAVAALGGVAPVLNSGNRSKLADGVFDEDWMVVTSFGTLWRRRNVRLHFQEARPRRAPRSVRGADGHDRRSRLRAPSDAVWRLLDSWAEQRKHHQMKEESAR